MTLISQKASKGCIQNFVTAVVNLMWPVFAMAVIFNTDILWLKIFAIVLTSLFVVAQAIVIVGLRAAAKELAIREEESRHVRFHD